MYDIKKMSHFMSQIGGTIKHSSLFWCFIIVGFGAMCTTLLCI